MMVAFLIGAAIGFLAGFEEAKTERRYGQTRAVCPYYLRDSRLKISCVPVTEQAACCAVEFDSEQEKRRYMQEHCFKRQCCCAVRRMLEGEQGGGFAEVRR